MRERVPQSHHNQAFKRTWMPAEADPYDSGFSKASIESVNIWSTFLPVALKLFRNCDLGNSKMLLVMALVIFLLYVTSLSGTICFFIVAFM